MCSPNLSVTAASQSMFHGLTLGDVKFVYKQNHKDRDSRKTVKKKKQLKRKELLRSRLSPHFLPLKCSTETLVLK